jgi:hypothetical protein
MTANIIYTGPYKEDRKGRTRLRRKQGWVKFSAVQTALNGYVTNWSLL